MSEFKGSKGKIEIKWKNSDLVEIRSASEVNKPICELDSYYYSKRVMHFEELKANVELIVEAFEIRQQIPFSLTELKRQRDEMLKMLKEITNQIEDGRTYVTKHDIDKLIESATEIK
jgi:hypothetical protein